jgi:sortase A
MANPVHEAPRPDSRVPLLARVLGSVGRTLITAGVVVLLFVAFQLWGTNIQEARAQGDLRSEFDGTVTAAQDQFAVFTDAGTIDTGTIDTGTIDTGTIDTGTIDDDALPAPSTTTPEELSLEILALFFPEDGDAIARIEIPEIGLDKIVVNGVQVSDLRKGPGQYPGTAGVGTEGNTSIAGHRTTYGAPFNRIDELRPGDEIHLTGVLGRFTYRVVAPEIAFPDREQTLDSVGDGHIIVNPGATWVLGEFGDDRVTLTACHPKLSSRQRIIVAAELVEPPVKAPEFDPEIVAVVTGEEPVEPVLVGETQLPAEPITLDEGLNGERGAIPGAVAWMVAATAIWVLAGIIGRARFRQRGERIAVRMVGLVPVAICLWFSFDMIDRALPAG